MDANTIELLKECSSGCQMATESVRQVREYAEGAKLKELLEAYTGKHEELEKRISELLGEYRKEESEPKCMAELMSRMKIKTEMFLHPDDHQVAKLMMDGCNMGIQSVAQYLNKYTDASRESQELARKLIKIEEDFMVEMKEFV